MRGLIRFLCTVIAIAILVALALVILDMTHYAHDSENATAYAVIMGVRNLFPADWVQTYDGWRASFLRWLGDVLDFAVENL